MSKINKSKMATPRSKGGTYKVFYAPAKVVESKNATFRVYHAADSGKKSASVLTKRVSAPKGNREVVRALDANTASFGTDLRYVFEKNVGEALRENKRVKGK